MSTPLRVLVLEDRPEDADLMIHALRKADFDPAWERVESEPEFLAHLAPELDLILADYTLPQFDALRALGLLKESGLDIPFIVVTGSISEEAAVSAMMQGASDYLLKDRLTRLGPAVVGAIGQKRLRDEKRRIDIVLNENERLYRVLFQNAPIGLGLLDSEGRILALNEALLVAAGYSFGEASQIRDVAVFFGDRAEARRALQSIQQNKAVRQELVRLERKDGAGYDALLTVTPVVLGGRPCLQLMVEDVTERMRAEAALRESEERYRKLVELSPDSIGVHCEGKVVYVNPAAVELFHANRPEDLLGLPVMQLIHPDYRAIAMERVRRSYENSLPAAVLEEAIVTLDGQSIEVEISAAPIVHEGKPATQIIIRDISERKQAERALRESEERYRRLAENAPDAIYRYRVSPHPGFEYVSPAATAITGYTPEEFYADQDLGLGLVHPDDRETFAAAIGGGARPGEATTLRAVRKDGRGMWIEHRMVSIVDEHGAIIAVEGIARDVSVRMQTQAALHHRVAELEALYQTSLQTMAQNDLQALLKAVVESAARLTGGDRGALYLPTADGARLRLQISFNLGRDYTGTEVEMGEGISGRAALERRVIMVEDYNAWEGRSPKFRDSGVRRVLTVPMLIGDRLVGVLNVADLNTGSYGEDEIRLVSLFAEQAAMAIEGARLLDETGRRAAYLEALTTTAQALGAAAAPEVMYASVLEEVARQLRAEGATLSLLVPEAREIETVLAVGAWEATTGMRLTPGQGIVGMVASSGVPFVSGDARGDPRLARPELLKDIPAIACVPLTIEGQVIGCIMVGRHAPLSAEEVRLLTGLAEIAGNAIHRARVMETLEERVSQRTQELQAANGRLQELDRMKTEFVSNVTHELRTPITNVLLYLDLARRSSSEPKRSHYFDVLKSESVRLGTLIESVLTLSRLERGAVPMNLEPHPLDALLADVRVAHQARADAKGITLEHEPDASLPVAWVSRVQMHQVLSNLVGNAVAYAPPGVTVRLGTARQQVAGKDFVGAVVHNTGTVIAPEDMSHLFERFYRGAIGRESGEPGTGLGLAISKEIVERHHGWIEVESSQQAGTTFSVWLPAGPQA